MIGNQSPNSAAVVDPQGQGPTAGAEHLHQTKVQAIKAFLKQHSGSQLNRNMGAGSMMAIVGTAISIASYPFYLHYLGYHRYGLWLVLSVVVSVAQLGNLGIPWALLKLVAEEHSHGNWEGVKTYINLGCGIILTAGIVFCVIITAARQMILHWFKLTGADAAVVYSMLPYIAVLSLVALLFSTFNAGLGGLGRMDLCSYNETLSQIFVIVFSAVLLFMGYDLWGMTLGTLAAYVLAQVISLVQVQRRMPIRLIARTSVNRHQLRLLLGTGGWILTSGAFAGLLLPFTRLMLSRYASLEAVAVNDMCVTGSIRVKNIFDAAFRPMIPELSGAQVKGKGSLTSHLRSIDRRAFMIVFAVGLPVFVVLILAMNPLLHLWLHRSFNSLLPGTFRIALVGGFLSLLGSSAYYMLIGLGSARDSAYSAGIQFFINAAFLLAVVLFAQRLTVEQAAIAFSLATGASTLYLRIRLYRFVRNRGLKAYEPASL